LKRIEISSPEIFKIDKPRDWECIVVLRFDWNQWNMAAGRYSYRL